MLPTAVVKGPQSSGEGINSTQTQVRLKEQRAIGQWGIKPKMESRHILYIYWFTKWKYSSYNEVIGTIYKSKIYSTK